MSEFDRQYLNLCYHILEEGYFENNRTGMKAYKYPHAVMSFDLQEDFPILTTKKVAFQTLVKELLWIYVDQSNDVRRLKAQGVNIWNGWEMDGGTIGTSYGYVVKKYKQIDTLLHTLKTDPTSRRMMIDLWQIPELDTGALYPCCFNIMFDVTEGEYLNAMLIQRSGDMGLGVPFNTTQYAVLVHLLAQTVGLKPGLFTHVINNAHIYENHVNALLTQMERDEFKSPTLRINPDVKDFYHFQPTDISLEGYSCHDKLDMGGVSV